MTFGSCLTGEAETGWVTRDLLPGISSPATLKFPQPAELVGFSRSGVQILGKVLPGGRRGANCPPQHGAGAIDRGAPGDMILLSAILNENIKLPKDRRAFLNQALLALIEPLEWQQAWALLATVVDLHKEAGAAYARLAGHVGQASVARISRGLAAVRLDKDGIPFAGSEE